MSIIKTEQKIIHLPEQYKRYYRESKEQTLSNWSHGKEHCKRAKRPEFQSQLCHLLTLTLGKSQPLWASVSLSVKQKNNP